MNFVEHMYYFISRNIALENGVLFGGSKFDGRLQMIRVDNDEENGFMLIK